jgi:hypothetical protein
MGARWRHGVIVGVVACSTFAGGASLARGAAAQDEPPASTVPSPLALPTDVTVPAEPGVRVTTTVPPGCPEPIRPAAVFLGHLERADSRTARFRVVQIRQGSLEGHQVGDLVDVDYNDDIRYLATGRDYVVAVEEVPGERLRLRSRAVRLLPLFGGDEVASINDPRNRGECPSVTDPIITHNGDGTNVESGVFTTFFAARREIAWAVARPALAGFALLLGLVVVKQTLVGTARLSARLLARRRRRYLGVTRR